MCEVYENVLDVRKCPRWFTKFRFGDLSLEDGVGRGHHIEVDIEALKALVESNSRQHTREMATKLNVSHETVRTCLKNLGKVLKEGVLVPQKLPPEILL
jgi:hypothetical protein